MVFATARKSFGGRAALRRQLTTLKMASSSKEGEEEGRTTRSVRSSSKKRKKTADDYDNDGLEYEMGFDFGVNNNKVKASTDRNHSDIASKPIFDLDNTKEVKKYLPNFKVQRHTRKHYHGLIEDEAANAFLDTAIENLCQKYKDSSFVMIYESDGEVDWIAEQHIVLAMELQQEQERSKNDDDDNNKKRKRRRYPYLPIPLEICKHYVALNELLHTGKLHEGVDLRGNKETAQFGLVANRYLPPGMPIAVETGMIQTKSYHEEEVCSKNPMLGLSANEIPSRLLKPLLNKRKNNKRNQKVWNNYYYSKNNGTADDDVGFVVESSKWGNETKFIEDAAWMHAGSGLHPKPPNLVSSLVIDLRRKSLTVGFFVNEEQTVGVKKGEELLMDWGCWEEISQVLLPGQVLLSILQEKQLRDAYRSLNTLHKDKKQKRKAPNEKWKKQISSILISDDNVDTETSSSSSTSSSSKQPSPLSSSFGQMFFNATHLKGIENLSASEYGERFRILRDIYFSNTYESSSSSSSSSDEEDEGTTKTKIKEKGRKAVFPPRGYKRLRKGAIDYTSPEKRCVVRPTAKQYSLLSEETRLYLNRVSANSPIRKEEYDDEDSKKIQILLRDVTDLSTRVEVVEITDVRNPAKLLSIPGTKIHGVLAKRKFYKNDPVLAYGGLLIDDDSDFEFDSSMFDIDPTTYDCLKNCRHRLTVSGKNSVAGKINDPTSLVSGLNIKREANLEARNHFDFTNGIPQVILYAIRDIEVNDELLYNYGMDYWKVMWKIFMMEHATYVANTNQTLLSLRASTSSLRSSTTSLRSSLRSSTSSSQN